MATAVGRIVVVGASLAGWRVAESVRRNGFAGELVLIGEEPYEPYDRPPLSKTVLSGWIGTDKLALPHTPGLDARWVLGVAATGVDRAAGTVHLADGRAIGYDRLVIATGARARPWPVAAEAALGGVHLLRGREDADRLRADLLAAPRRVLVIGGGFTGSEVASSCLDMGIPVTLVQRGPAPLSGALGTAVGAALGARQRAHGLDLRVGTTVQALAGEGRLTGALLSDGTPLDAEVAVVALGSVRNTEWLSGAGLSADSGGVDCDTACRAITLDGTPAEEVYVIGDAARWRHPPFDAPPAAFEHWGNAIEQADTAAHNLTHGGALCHTLGLPQFWSDQFGMNIKSVGLPHIADRVMLAQGSCRRGPFVVVYGRDGVTVGAAAVDSPRVLDGYAALVADSAPFPPLIAANDSPATPLILDSGATPQDLSLEGVR
ncbi:NAD(P)/FAD-dependent oxidoreductase [Nocardia alni]|uniref:NAD(P)/FAD-dependent oxidoreductase n=1 Tax=Nocardia alni TaxID=2815723 RepID=UPI001C2217F5|nr:FAD-dependent oxidoreductase [Nocardia alni]